MSDPVKCHPICPVTQQPCVAPCEHLAHHMPNDGREPKLLGFMPFKCGLPHARMVEVASALKREHVEALLRGEALVIDAYYLAYLGLCQVVAPPATRQLRLTDLGREVLSMRREGER